MNAEERKLLEETAQTLNKIIQSCVHPDTAFRAVFVELDPIRNSLKKIQTFLDRPENQ